ncbi:MAG: DUF3486 family protein [Proteobacteria bacterium]|nr:DUF3486 family protein [Pseudomonadota bacterium]
MPPPSKIDQLPAEVREELDRELIAGGFGGFVRLSEWLSAKGYEIGKSAIGERSQRLKRRLAAITASTEAMKMVAAAAPDDAEDRSNAIISLVQTDLFEALVEFQEAAANEADDITPAERIALYGKAAKNIASLTRASVARTKWASEVRTRIDSARAEIRKLATGAGMTEATMAAIDARLQGVVA